MKTGLQEVCRECQGNLEFLFEVTLNGDSQFRELHFNVAAGFTNRQLMKTLVIVNKISMDLMK